MRPISFAIATGAVLAAAAGPASAVAAPAAPARQTIRCVGTADGCGATVPIAGGARDKVVTVKLTDTNLKLESVTAVGAVKDGYDLSKERHRAGGSEFRFTLNAKKRNPKRARIVLVFSAPSAAPTAPTGALKGGWKWFDAILDVGAGNRVTITGGGAGTSLCTREETTETFVMDRAEVVRRLVYYAKGDGDCAINLSRSQFRVQVWNPAGQLIVNGRLFYGMTHVASDYIVACDYAGPWTGATCFPTETAGGQPAAKVTKS